MKNPTQWLAPNGQGYFSSSNGGPITTLSGSTLTTLSGSSLIIDSEVYSPKYASLWTKTGKNQTQWTPGSGQGYVINQGNLFIQDNLGNFITDNSGNNLVTNTSYNVPKYLTAWSDTGV